MKRFKVGVVLVGTTFLWGCGAQTATTTGVGSKVSSTVAQVEVALTVAERAALIYKRLPPCPTKPLCSDPAIVARILDLDNQAYNAVVLARSNPALLSAAILAVNMFSSAIPKGQ